MFRAISHTSRGGSSSSVSRGGAGSERPVGSASDAYSTPRRRAASHWLTRMGAYMPTLDLLSLANHLYLLISLGYLLVNWIRVASYTPSAHAGDGDTDSALSPTSPAPTPPEEGDTLPASVETSGSDIGAHGVNWRLILLSDTVLLILALLFVIDSGLFAMVHARSMQMHSATSPTHTLVTSGSSASPRMTTVTRLHVSPAMSHDSDGHDGLEMHSLLSSRSSSGSAHSAVPIRSDSPAPSPRSPHPPRRRASLLRRFLFLPSFRYLRAIFLSSAEGLAELLNILGGLGYAWTALIPFAYFVVSEETERTLDRTANVLDNFAMLCFFVGSFVYYYIWHSRREDDGMGGGGAQAYHASGNGAATAWSRCCRRIPSLRSLCALLARDPYLVSILLNILGCCFYFASTLYGFGIRLQVGEQLDHNMEVVQAAQEAIDQGDMAQAAAYSAVRSGGVLYRSAQILFSSRQDYSSPLHPSAPHVHSTAMHAGNGPLVPGESDVPLGAVGISAPAALPPVGWELGIESALHSQQFIALIGDALFLVCALFMEVAYYQDAGDTQQQQQQGTATRDKGYALHHDSEDEPAGIAASHAGRGVACAIDSNESSSSESTDAHFPSSHAPSALHLLSISSLHHMSSSSSSSSSSVDVLSGAPSRSQSPDSPSLSPLPLPHLHAVAWQRHGHAYGSSTPGGGVQASFARSEAYTYADRPGQGIPHERERDRVS